MASSSRLTMAVPAALGASVSAGGVPSNLSIAEQLMQLDQAITLTLQDIDANLSAAHQTVTAKLLPAVKRYGVASARTWQGAKFWMKFFEAAADVSLSGTSGLRADDTHGNFDATESDLLHDADDITQSQFADDYYDDDEEFADERAGHELNKATKKSAQAPPAEALDGDEDDFDDSLEMSRLRDAMPVATSTDGQTEARSGRNSTTPRADSRRPKISSEVPHPRELGSTTPNEKPFSASLRVLNAEASVRRWDGIADLRSTPLNARGKRFGARLGAASGSRRLSTSPQKGKGASQSTQLKTQTVQEWSDEEDADEDEEGDSLPPLLGMSPPQTLQFSVPRSRYMNTPAKEAARLMVDDVLRTIDGIADPLAMAARTRQERTADAARQQAALSGSSSSRPHPSVVGTPLRKDKPKSKSTINRGRDSLPTPPTLTKLPPRPLASYISDHAAAPTTGLQASTTPLAAPGTARTLGSAGSSAGVVVPGSIGTRSNAGRVMDEGEDEGAAGFDFSELQLRQGTSAAAVPGSADAVSQDRVGTLLNLDDEDSDSQSDSEDDDDALVGANVIPAYPATASKSSWTIGSAQGSSGGSRTTGSRQGRSIEDDTLFGVRAPSASTSAGLRTNSGPMQNPFAKSNTAVPNYKPVDSTVHGGRSLIGADRSDTYSAPSPTPFGFGGGSSSK
ncbi:hypothetical protein OC844_000596 [Tilletia horrida]|nr:hypothetical protein OC844_000596 [Tilletia horrida]